ncbi:MAG: hypothetical protein ABIX01_10860 [Chitinophagaceae bacterium]
MEPELRAFLVRIMQTISLVIFWMLTNCFFGIKLGYLFFDDGITTWHIVYYVLMIASGIWVFVYLMRKWKKAPTYDRKNDQWIYPS